MGGIPTLSRSLPAWSQGSTATVAPPQPLPAAVSLADPRNQAELPGARLALALAGAAGTGSDIRGRSCPELRPCGFLRGGAQLQHCHVSHTGHGSRRCHPLPRGRHVYAGKACPGCHSYTGCTYTYVWPQSPSTGLAGLAFPTRAAPTGALASVMEGTFLSSGILLWNSGPFQPVPCLLTINYLIYIH